MRISRSQAERILAHAREGYPYEVCGILLGPSPGCVEAVLPVTNRETENPRRRYVIAPEDHLRIQRDARERGLEILGFYHSHPDHPARPSDTDREIAAQGLSDGVIHVVVGVAGGQEATPTAWIFRDRTQGFEEDSFEAE